MIDESSLSVTQTSLCVCVCVCTCVRERLSAHQPYALSLYTLATTPAGTSFSETVSSAPVERLPSTRFAEYTCLSQAMDHDKIRIIGSAGGVSGLALRVS